jgi:hypothetical protein
MYMYVYVYLFIFVNIWLYGDRGALIGRVCTSIYLKRSASVNPSGGM